MKRDETQAKPATLHASMTRQESEESRSQDPPSRPTHDGEILKWMLPDASAIFLQRPVRLVEILPVCDVVLDTNVLLVPYSARSEGFAAIRTTLIRLANEQRLFIPARVAREYARNRPERLRELLQNILNLKSQIAAPVFRKVPLIEGREETDRLAAAENAIRLAVTDYHSALQAIHDLVRDWQAHDPVSDFYAEICTNKSIVVEYSGAYSELRKELSERFAHRIPPGFKDASKEDGGEGDLIIWKTILELGAKRKRHLVFVSGDEKSDWQYRANHAAIFPRIELADEYRRASEGMTFHMLSLSALLQAFDNTRAAVQQVESAETQQQSSDPVGSRETTSPGPLGMDKDLLVIVLGAIVEQIGAYVICDYDDARRRVEHLMNAVSFRAAVHELVQLGMVERTTYSRGRADCPALRLTTEAMDWVAENLDRINKLLTPVPDDSLPF